MEKRLFIFVVLSLVIWGGYIGLGFYFNPPKPKNLADKAANKAKPQDKVDNKQEDLKAAKEEKPPKLSSETPDDEAVPATPRRRFTLGSLDPASGYNMLVTLDNRGGAVERIELNGPRFHDLDDLSGYFGHLALTDAKKNAGAVVNIVGPGTPAALAAGSDKSVGLRVDDVITAVNGTPVSTAADFVKYLEKNTKPDDTIKVTIARGVDSTAKPLAFNAQLIRRPLELIRPESNKGASLVDKSAGSIDPIGPPSYRLTLKQLGDASIAPRASEIEDIPSLHDAHWLVSGDMKQGEVSFTTTLENAQLEDVAEGAALKVTKVFRLVPRTEESAVDGYHLDLQIKIENTGDESAKLAYRLEGPNGLPLEGWWYSNKVHPEMWAGAGARDVAFNNGSHHLVGAPLLISHAKEQVDDNNPPFFDLMAANKDERKLSYIAVDTQYFASGLLPGDVLADDGGAINTFPVSEALALPLNVIDDKKWAKTTNVTFRVDSLATTLAPGKSIEDRYVIFAGPKNSGVLAHYEISPLIEYGWFPWVSRPLLFVLEGFYAATSNYGISIILLTVLVRLLLLPISMRQAKSAAKMQELAPEIAKLKEKFAGDMEKQSTAQRELFAKHGFNPMLGCLPMLAQLPIFIGLYRCLSVDIELREAELIPGVHWASNLAGPDQLARWKAFVWPSIGDEAHGWLGPYFNVLPLVTVALFMVQQKLFAPPAIDEEQKMQQKIMNFMTIFMGVMFYKVPAGLCIYFITSSLWGIAERKLIPKPKPGSTLAKLPPEKPDAGGGNGGGKKPATGPSGPSRLEKLFGMADAQLKQSKQIQPRKKAKK